MNVGRVEELITNSPSAWVGSGGRDGNAGPPTARSPFDTRQLRSRSIRDRSCLVSKGLRAVGGPAFPSRPPDPTQADGELVISSSTRPTFIAFYTDAARAERIEPALKHDDAHMNVI